MKRNEFDSIRIDIMIFEFQIELNVVVSLNIRK